MARVLPASPSSGDISQRAGPGEVPGGAGVPCHRARPREQAVPRTRAQVPAEPVTASLTVETEPIFSPENGEWIRELS